MGPENNKYRYYILLFALIISYHFINNFLWLENSISIQGVDTSNHLLFQLRFQRLFDRIFSEPNTSLIFKIKELVKLFKLPMDQVSAYWPNFVFFSSTIFSAFFGNTLFIIKLSMLPYLLILLFSTYLIGEIISNKRTGLLAMFLVSVYPLIFESSRQFGLDFPLTALVTISVLLLLKSDYFKSTYFTILLGISTGAGLLIKGQFIIFIIWPLIAILGSYLFKNNKLRLSGRVILNVIIFIVISVCVASLWWQDKIEAVVRQFVTHTTSSAKFLESGNSLQDFRGVNFYLFHLKALVFGSTGVTFALLFFCSLPGFIKTKFKYKLMILSWVLIPFLLFSIVFVVKHDRFLMPILPAVAIISAWGVEHMRASKTKSRLIIFLVILGLIQYWILSYFYSPYKDTVRKNKLLDIFGSSSYGASPNYNFKKINFIKEIADLIDKDCGGINNCKIGMVILSRNIPTFEILYWLSYWSPNLYFFDCIDQYTDFFKELPNLSYLIFVSRKSDKLYWPKGKELLDLLSTYHNANFTRIQEEHPESWTTEIGKISLYESKFNSFETFEFPSRTYWYIYKRKP